MPTKTKAQWCDIGLTIGERKAQESAAWQLTPRKARTRFAGKRAIRFDPPKYAWPLDEMPKSVLSRYIRSRCQRKPPKGRYVETVPLGRASSRRRRKRGG